MRIALGTAQWGLKYGISNTDGIPSDEELKDIMSVAQKNNITLLDTALHYGRAEKRIGKILNPENKIVTKIGNFEKGNNVKDQVQKSLENLQNFKIYGCLFHDSKELIQNKNLWEELLEYKKSGRIIKIGYSLYEPYDLLELFNFNLFPDIIQIPYSILDRKFEPYFDLLKKNNVEIHIRSVFLQGLYFKPIDGLDSKFDELKKPLLTLREIGLKNRVSILDLALYYVLQNPLIDYLILGVETAKQLVEIINASQKKLSKKVFNQIKNLKLENQRMLNPVNWK